jgi:hypothetical protein
MNSSVAKHVTADRLAVKVELVIGVVFLFDGLLAGRACDGAIQSLSKMRSNVAEHQRVVILSGLVANTADSRYGATRS